jgi:hypothetical protein
MYFLSRNKDNNSEFHKKYSDFELINNAKNLENIYKLERPYKDMDYFNNIKNNYPITFLPSILVDLQQIYDLFSNIGEDVNEAMFKTKYSLKHYDAIREMSLKNIPSDPKKWDEYVDDVLEKIDSINDNSNLLKLVKTQILGNGELFKAAAYLELEAHNDDSVLFWRYTTKRTSQVEIQQNKDLSFGDSILAGYIRDGMCNSDINLGLENYSACVFSYYDIHRQGIEIVKTGELSGKAIEKLPSNYQSYLKNLNKHEMYCLKLSYEEVKKLNKSGDLHIPKNTITSSTCFESGEEFHPKLKISNTEVKEMLLKNTVSFCIDKKIIPDFSKDIPKLNDTLISDEIELNNEKELSSKLFSKDFIKVRLDCFHRAWEDVISKEYYELIEKLRFEILHNQHLDLRELNADYREIVGSIDDLNEATWLNE